MRKNFILILIVCILLMSYCAGALTPKNTKTGTQEKKYIIITTTELVDSVHSLQKWKEYLNFSVEVVTIDWIAAQYSGEDLQEQIRNYLIDTYEEGTPLYVLLVGSEETIPSRTCHPIPWEYPDNLRTDFYYADLTGDWNEDDDEYFGEYDHDAVDFIAEASVGRIPSDDPLYVKTICQNSIRYENDNGAWKKNVLSLAAIIYYQNMTSFNWTYARSDGATLMEECWTDIFQPQGYTHVCMYENEGISPSTYPYDYPLTQQNVVSQWTQGYGIVNMIGHSSETKVTRLIWNFDDGDNIPEFSAGELIYRDFLRFADGKNLGTETPPIVFSDGCSQFHAVNNMGKEFLEEGAAVAYIGTTDLGFYNITRVWNDESDGGVFSMDYYFFYYFVNEEMTCGDALNAAKSYFADHFMFTYYDADWIYRCLSTLYGFSLYGDPALAGTTEKTDTTPPALTVENPEGSLYLFGRPLIPLPGGRTIAVGEVPFTLSAADEECGIATIEIWIDEVLRNSTGNDTFEWIWDEQALGRHDIRIVANNTVGTQAQEEFSIWVLNFNIL